MGFFKGNFPECSVLKVLHVILIYTISLSPKLGAILQLDVIQTKSNRQFSKYVSFCCTLIYSKNSNCLVQLEFTQLTCFIHNTNRCLSNNIPGYFTTLLMGVSLLPLGYSRKKSKQGGLRINFFEPPPPPEFFIFFFFTPGNSRQNKAQPLDIPQNCVRSFGNSKTKNKDPWKFHIIFSWLPLEIPLCF